MTGVVSGIRLLSWVIGSFCCLALLLLNPLGTATAAVADDPFPLERLFSFGPDGTDATGFGRTDSIALDQQNEHVYVLERDGETGSLLKFSPEGEPVDFDGTSPYIEGNRIGGLEPFVVIDPNDPDIYSSSTQVAVDPLSGVIYVTETDAIRAFEADGDPAEFTAGPGAGTSEIPGFTELVSVAVDANGTIYASDRAGAVSVFASSGAPLTSFPVASPENIGVDSSGAVYVLQGQWEIKKFSPTSPLPVTESTTYTEATFAVPLFASFIIGFNVDPVNGDVYVLESDFGNTWIQRYDGSAALVESFGAPDSSTEGSAFGVAEGIAVWGLGKEVTEGEAVKLYVGALSGDPALWKVTALGRKIIIGPPEIGNTSVLDVTADSARLRAWVDPNTAATTYRFEYGLEDCAVSACTTVPAAGASAGDGEQPVEVSHSIFGLQPDTTYYYRVLAKNPLGPTVVGPTRTFTTQSLGIGFELIDSRVWELVSPPDKRGAELKGIKGGLIRAASDGQGLAYLSLGTIEPGPQGNRAPEFSNVLARRGPDGWRSRDLSSPNREVIPFGSEAEGELKFFNPDLSRGVVMPRGSTPLSPQASERTPYLWQDGEPPTYTPLLTGKEGFANVPPGTEFGGPPENTLGVVQPIGATPSLSHVVLRSELSVPLVVGFPPPEPQPLSLYLWREGQLQPISVLPEDEGGSMSSQPELGSGRTTLQNAISADGSRVFWGRVLQSEGPALYMRDTVAEETVRLDVVDGGTGAGAPFPLFQGASADGTVVFFKDVRKLTPDASPTGFDLYRCEIPAGSPAEGCATLTNLSAPLPGSGESAEILGMASGLSEDGTRIYFTARGVLDTAPNQYGESAQAGAPNLYLWEEGEGTRFVATLDEEDQATWGQRGASNAAFGEASKLGAAVSPGGRYFVFMSQRDLSGYVNLEATTGEPVQEVFRYDAVADSLECLSCNPSGAAPEGEEPENRPLINPLGQYTGVQAAAALPGGFKNELHYSTYRTRVALDNGRVFFNAFDSLVPVDSNGEWDVYQWEPTGVGGCGPSSDDAATVGAAGGCVSLLSSGTAEEEAGFLDASVSGDDVFFLTPARLSAIDVDDELDVYDARVGGIAATVESHPDCQGETCRSGAAVRPGGAIPGSATFVGPGNVKPNKGKRCPKGKRKVRSKGKVRCVPRKRPHRHRKASQNRGTAR
ncbi:MAG TPA: hypothetical protein VFZ19_01770 [Solirubrobacterales bacterium]